MILGDLMKEANVKQIDVDRQLRVGKLDEWTFYKDASGAFRWTRECDQNDEKVGASTQGYSNKDDCVVNAMRMGLSYGHTIYCQWGPYLKYRVVHQDFEVALKQVSGLGIKALKNKAREVRVEHTIEYYYKNVLLIVNLESNETEFYTSE